MADLHELLEKALDLAVEDRATLAEQLLASLEELDHEESDRLWAAEAERRLKQLRNGQARTVSSSEVHAKAERLLR